jgi:predicted transcriptional regulator
MTPLENIRKNLFRVSQSAFGEIAGTTQASVSRWENGELEPGHTEMARIRSEAAERGIEWDDRLFFEAPSNEKITGDAA